MVNHLFFKHIIDALNDKVKSHLLQIMWNMKITGFHLF